MKTKTFFLFILVGFLLLQANLSFAQTKKHDENKPVSAVYSGGHRNIIILRLYSDSTFTYSNQEHLFGITRRSTGAWLKTDSVLTLYTRKNFSFLKRPHKKYWAEDFRIRGNKLLMYSKEQEQTADSSFYKAYYTLTLDN